MLMQSVSELDTMLARQEAVVCKLRLREFIVKAWPILEPATPLVWNWHIDVICDILEQVTRGELDQVIINVPPGTMKSLTTSVMWPAWMWARDRKLRFLNASYSDDLVMGFNTKMKQIIESPWFVRSFGKIDMLSNQDTKGKFQTLENGWRIGTTIGGLGTGEHPDIACIDDPIKASEAISAGSELRAALKRVNNWADRTLSTRGMTRNVRTLLVMQRLHPQDLTGHFLAQGGWTHVCLPMRFDPERADPRDPRTKPGELLWPELIPEAKVRKVELKLGPFGTAGQLQQKPAPEGGGLFKREWFEIVDEVPTDAMRGRGWDTAASEGEGDYTVGTLMSRANGVFYIENVVRGQWSPNGVESNIKLCADNDGRRTRIREEQEGGSAGKAVIGTRARALAGWDYKGIPVTGDKITRASPFRAQCEARNVKLKRGPWNEEWLQEVCAFPVGIHDDQVDSASCIFNDLTMGLQRVKVVSAAWG